MVICHPIPLTATPQNENLQTGRSIICRTAILTRKPLSRFFGWRLDMSPRRPFMSLPILGIADYLTQGALTAQELASKTGSHPDALARLLLALVAFGILNRNADGALHADPHG